MGKDIITTLKIAKPMNMEYSIDFQNPKEKLKFIKRVKGIIRGSKEYKDYIRFLKDNVNMRQCAMFPKIKQETGTKVSIEIHHGPLPLHDIVRIVLNKQMDEGKPISDLGVADEVMELHYNNMVGLVPLSKTIHAVITNSDKIVIPLTLFYGDYKKFLDEYQDYIEDDILTRLEKMVKETKELTSGNFEALETKYEYINVDGYELPQKIDLSDEIAKTA